MWGRLRHIVFTAVAGVLLAGCATNGEPTNAGGPTSPPTTTTCVSEPVDLEVEAENIGIDGSLTAEQMQEVTWALERFSAAGLELPSRITFVFDPTRASCDGTTGRCRLDGDPPLVAVCEPDGDNAHRVLDRKITLLHELAHVWHRHLDEPEGAAAVVGGEPTADDVRWEDRTEERVAVVISWGLLDQPRRPVRSSLSCVELVDQFRALTGAEPLGPLPVGCGPSDEPR